MTSLGERLSRSIGTQKHARETGATAPYTACSENARLRPRPLRTVLLSIVLFLVIDTLVFRSGLYVHLCGSADSVSGKVFDIVHFNQVATSDASRDVLLIGNSRTEWGFGTDDFASFFPSARIRPIMGASPKSNEEWWYFELLAIDPHHTRYKGIVIPIAGYQISPWREDKQNTYYTAQAMAPIVGITQWPGFVMSFTGTDLRLRALTLALFSSHDYALDVQEMILEPINRIRWRDRRNALGQGWLHDDHGASGDLQELTIDPRTRKPVTYPDRFDELQRHETDQEFETPSPDEARKWTARNAAFEARWLGRIVAAYRGSRTQLIFINIPHAPMALPAQQPIPDAPDVRRMIPDLPNVTILPEDAFTHFERPALFADVLHMNDVGHRAFTLLLGQRLIAILEPDRAADSSHATSSE
jgi:hypothetical protein